MSASRHPPIARGGISMHVRPASTARPRERPEAAASSSARRRRPLAWRGVARPKPGRLPPLPRRRISMQGADMREASLDLDG